jgi:hypothetical protein
MTTGPTVLGVTYHIGTGPIPLAVPDLGEELPFRVSQVATREYLPAGVMVEVTIRPAWRAPAPEDDPAGP